MQFYCQFYERSFIGHFPGLTWLASSLSIFFLFSSCSGIEHLCINGILFMGLMPFLSPSPNQNTHRYLTYWSHTRDIPIGLIFSAFNTGLLSCSLHAVSPMSVPLLLLWCVLQPPGVRLSICQTPVLYQNSSIHHHNQHCMVALGLCFYNSDCLDEIPRESPYPERQIWMRQKNGHSRPISQKQYNTVQRQSYYERLMEISMKSINFHRMILNPNYSKHILF